MAPICRYIAVVALRDRLFGGLLLGIAATVAMCVFLGAVAAAEGGAMAAVFAGAALRAILVGGAVLFVCVSVARLVEGRELELMLSRPLSRDRLLAALWLGYGAVALAPTAAAIGAVALLAPAPAGGIALWGASVALEVNLMVALALFFALALRSAVAAVLAAIGFYLLARMMGFFVAIAEAGADAGMAAVGATILKGIALLLPRLDLNAQTAWLVHGAGGGEAPWLVAAQYLVYLPLLLAATAFDFRRREF